MNLAYQNTTIFNLKIYPAIEINKNLVGKFQDFGPNSVSQITRKPSSKI